MKILTKHLYILPVIAFCLFSCENDVSVDDFTAGGADFSNYVALGNSLTAGVADGTLYTSAQENSYPALLAEQFAEIGGGSFSQPMVSDDIGGLTLGGNVIASPKFVLDISSGSPTPVRITGTPTTEVSANIASQGPFNNLAIPGAKASHLLYDQYGSLQGIQAGTANPYYARFANPNTSILAQAVSQSPTFYTLWIGNNDVLGYASQGGSNEVITPTNDFQTYIGAILQGLSSTGAKGVIANIPNVTDVPYFTVVPENPIPLDLATANQVNGAYAAYNGALDQFALYGVISAEEAEMRKIQFSEGLNYPVFIDEDLTPLLYPGTTTSIPKMRQVKPGERHTLTAASVVGTLADPTNPSSVIGVGVPLGAEYVLTATELEKIDDAITAYNQIINATAANFGVPVANMNSYFSQIGNDGLLWNGADYSVDFVTGGLFSLDGIHPTQKGYAFIANQFIRVINEAYDAHVPMVDPNDYPGTNLP